MREVVLGAADAGRRLDKYLLQYLNAAPRSLIYKLLRTKHIKLNGRRTEGGEITTEGDRITFYLSPDTLNDLMVERTVADSSGALDIVYEDTQLLLLNKPAGLQTHVGMPGQTDTLLARALYYLKCSGAYETSREAVFTPAFCNRLDVNTSGLIVCGKTSVAVRAVNALFAERGVDKAYIAVVHGIIHGCGTLEGVYEKDTQINTARIMKAPCVDKGLDGVPVVTAYEAIRQSSAYTLLCVRPITGRSHQIRAHLAAIGHPLAGDVKYGGKRTRYAPAQLLHCHRLAFAETTAAPNIAGRSWCASLPEGMRRCIQDWFGLHGDITGEFYNGGDD